MDSNRSLSHANHLRSRTAIALRGILSGAALCTCALAQSPAGAAPPGQANRVSISVIPERPRIERSKNMLHVNCDFQVQNIGVAKQLDRIDLRVLDSKGALVQKKYVDRGGTAPGVNTIRWRSIAADSTCHVFNPFHTFDTEVELHTLKFLFRFRYGNRAQTQTITVTPDLTEPKTRHRLPIEGRLLVTDGHDFLSHHRRLGMDHPIIVAIGATKNGSRYALDLAIVDKQGQEFANSGSKHEDWYGWNAPVFATADGVVVAMETNYPDNTLTARGGVVYSSRITPKNPASLLGNYMIIDHQNGEFSALGHLKMGSVKVEKGQRVKAGEHIANVGLSGATTHMHLHFQVQDGADPWHSEGIPTYFDGYRRHLGSRSVVVTRGSIDSGDIAEHITGDKRGSRR